jgi:glycosyltransferase involved in cell wall biosynthesis
MRISVVAGCAKQHLFGTIYELEQRKMLAVAYVPLGLKLRESNPLRKFGFINRAANRFPELESVPKIQVHLPEIFYQLGRYLTTHDFHSLGELLTEISHKLFSFKVNRRLQDDDSDVIIIRAGFGQYIECKDKLRICELSMAHPLVDLSLISGKGLTIANDSEVGRIGRLILSDLRKADRILVNSEFVKRTCVLAGEDASKIFVAYLPPAHEIVQKFEDKRGLLFKEKIENRVLFVGTLSQRKGIDLFLKIAQECFKSGQNLQFTAIGNWSGISSEFKKNFLAMDNISIIPWVTHEELVHYYATASFLLCPTRSDGGARVITEAMLFGNVVIASNVSGSPILNGVTGFEIEIENEQSFIKKVLRILLDKEANSHVGARASDSVYLDLSFDNYLNNVIKACQVV